MLDGPEDARHDCAAVGEDREAAQGEAERLVRSMPDEDDAQGAVVVRSFGEAVLGRLRDVGSAAGNLRRSEFCGSGTHGVGAALRVRSPLLPVSEAYETFEPVPDPVVNSSCRLPHG